MIKKINIFNEEQYFRIWTRQLLREFDGICWHNKIKLQLPSFEIIRSKQVMGTWRPSVRTIQISSVLILEYSWQITLNILKHEMAHQICSEIFYCKDMPHGKEFRRACSMLGVSEGYRRAGGDLRENIVIQEKSALTVQGRKFINKVEKLLALAKSQNEHEAVLAMQKANELIEKYNLGKVTDHEQSPYTYVIINQGKMCIKNYQRHICTILRDFFYIKVVYSFLYDPLNDRECKTIELLGTIENITIAEYCYHFIENKLAALWRLHKHKYQGNAIRAKNSYYLGALKGFYVKLDRQKKNKKTHRAVINSTDIQTNKDLLAVEDRRLNDYVVKRFPRLVNCKSRTALIYTDSFDDGVKAGSKITIHKGVAVHAGNNGRLLS